MPGIAVGDVAGYGDACVSAERRPRDVEMTLIRRSSPREDGGTGTQWGSWLPGPVPFAAVQWVRYFTALPTLIASPTPGACSYHLLWLPFLQKVISLSLSSSLWFL